MRLAIFWPARVYFDGDEYTTDGFAHLWFPELARNFSGVDLIVPLRTGRLNAAAATIDTANITVCPLPSARSGWRMYTSHLPIILFGMLRLLAARRWDWDRVLIYEVQPLSQIWLALCGLAGLPVMLYVGGRHEQAVLSRNGERGWIMRSLVSGWSRWCSFVVPRLARRVLLVVTGQELVDIYSRLPGAEVYNVASSSVRRSDIITEARKGQRCDESNHTPVVLSVCRVTPIKGLEYLIFAAGELARRGIAVRLQIAGRHDGPYASELAEMAERHGIADSLEFLGPISPGSKLRSIYDAADIFVLPSLSEGTPKVILEAMSRGLPVIASAVGGIPDIIEDGQNGLLVPPGRDDDLARAIERVIGDVSLREQLSAEGLRTVAGLTVERQTARLAAIIKAERTIAAGGEERVPR